MTIDNSLEAKAGRLKTISVRFTSFADHVPKGYPVRYSKR